MTNPRAISTLESEKSKDPKVQPQIRQDRDWIAELAAQEAHKIAIGAFFRMIDRSKMIRVVTEGSAQPNQGAAG
jgi:hypothetical protein